jgi:hypothetical protein
VTAGRTRTRVVAILGLLTILQLAACGTGPDEHPLQGYYSASWEPSQLVSATVTCDRLVSHVLLAMSSLGEFDLSINAVDDCTRGGASFTFFEVLKLGKYTREGSVLAFTPDGEAPAAFTGTLEGEYVRLTLPPSVGALAPTDVELRVGPRTPY